MKKIYFAIIFILITINVSAQRIHTETFFEILGMLDEYISRFEWNTGEPNKELIESFYPNEVDLAAHFENLLHEYEREMMTSYNITRSVGVQGHISFKSSILTETINSLYIVDSNKIATLNPEVVLNASQECKLRYIKGCYLRYGTDFKIYFSNGPKKVLTIGKVLRQLNCKKITIYEPRGNLLPVQLVLSFNPCDEVKELLKLIPDKKELGTFNSKEYKVFLELN
jgi:hypothetical protein